MVRWIGWTLFLTLFICVYHTPPLPGMICSACLPTLPAHHTISSYSWFFHTYTFNHTLFFSPILFLPTCHTYIVCAVIYLPYDIQTLYVACHFPYPLYAMPLLMPIAFGLRKTSSRPTISSIIIHCHCLYIACLTLCNTRTHTLFLHSLLCTYTSLILFYLCLCQFTFSTTFTHTTPSPFYTFILPLGWHNNVHCLFSSFTHCLTFYLLAFSSAFLLLV